MLSVSIINVLKSNNRLCSIFKQNIKAKGNQPRQSTKKMLRNWEPAKNNRQSGRVEGCDRASLQKYKLLSYNILAQDLLTEHLYLYIKTDPKLLRWEHRIRRLREEMLRIGPDILCLQEMQYNHLRGLVRQIRGSRKLEYVFKKKTGHRTDGCAIIYDKNKFQLLEERSIEYHTPGKATLNRENIAVMVKFAEKGDNNTTKQFIVATTHLLYNPRREDVRKSQLEVLLKALQSFSAATNHNCQHLPVLLTGDFNFKPDSAEYELLTKESSKFSNRSVIREPLPPGVEPEEVDNVLAMSALNFGNETASTFQDRWITVDYILKSVNPNRGRIKIWSLYNLPNVQECFRVGSIPNKHLGSDHFSLAIMFSILNS